MIVGLVLVNGFLVLYFLTLSPGSLVIPESKLPAGDFPSPDEFFTFKSGGSRLQGGPIADTSPLPHRYRRLARSGLIGSRRSGPLHLADSNSSSAGTGSSLDKWELRGIVRSGERILAVLGGPRGEVYPVAVRERIPGTKIRVTRIGREFVRLTAPGHRSTRLRLRPNGAVSSGRLLTIPGEGHELP